MQMLNPDIDYQATAYKIYFQPLKDRAASTAK
jgi:hypothetical protein